MKNGYAVGKGFSHFSFPREQDFSYRPNYKHE